MSLIVASFGGVTQEPLRRELRCLVVDLAPAEAVQQPVGAAADGLIGEHLVDLAHPSLSAPPILPRSRLVPEGLQRGGASSVLCRDVAARAAAPSVRVPAQGSLAHPARRLGSDPDRRRSTWDRRKSGDHHRRAVAEVDSVAGPSVEMPRPTADDE